MDFRFSQEPEPHRARTQAMLQAHPELRGLIGKNPATAGITLALVLAQLGVMVWVKDQPIWVSLIVAWCVGAFLIHALYVMIHEAAHNLIFRPGWANQAAGILANLPSVVPGSASFRKYHLLHHGFQGVYELDADIPSRWEARLIGNRTLGKIAWLALFPDFQATRPFRLKEVSLFDRYVVANLAVQFAFDVLVIWLFGWKAFLYLVFSLFFSIGLHPLGARWVQRHYLVHGTDQETSSYYGPANLTAFNVGYHNEHHDLPSVPWNRLPRIKAMAPEYYDTLASHRSWTRLWLRFLFDPSVGLYSRMVRSNRGEQRSAAAPVTAAAGLAPGAAAW
jgi:sphingolipid delta-4 desaturase